jgi:hypothetical protein
VTGVGGEGSLANETRPEPSEGPLGFVRKAVEQDLADEEIEEGVAQKFETLVRLEGMLRVDPKEGAVRESLPIEREVVDGTAHELLDRSSRHAGVGGKRRVAHSGRESTSWLAPAILLTQTGLAGFRGLDEDTDPGTRSDGGCIGLRDRITHRRTVVQTPS